MLIIGTIGSSGAGKDSLVDYICPKYGFIKIAMGDIVKDFIPDNEPLNRKNLLIVSKKCIEKYGPDYFSKLAVKKVSSYPDGNFAIAGLKSYSDVVTFRSFFGSNFKLILVKVTDALERFQRIIERSDGFGPFTYEELIQKDKAEEELFQISKAMAMADFVILHDDDLKDFFKKIDGVMTEILLKER